MASTKVLATGISGLLDEVVDDAAIVELVVEMIACDVDDWKLDAFERVVADSTEDI